MTTTAHPALSAPGVRPEPEASVPRELEAGVRRELEAAHRRAADLAAELEALEDATAEGPDDEHDPDGSTVGYERARVGALLARSQADIAALGLAVARLDAGTYGGCGDCGRPIGDERLAALPSTTTCVACAGGHRSSLLARRP